MLLLGVNSFHGTLGINLKPRWLLLATEAWRGNIWNLVHRLQQQGNFYEMKNLSLESDHLKILHLQP